MEKLIGALAGAAPPLLASLIAGFAGGEPMSSVAAFCIGIALGAASIFAVAALERRRK